ncbi:zinc ribbon family protein [Aquimarina sp. MAR_2010_214]|uniref:zinc-ribbon domain-containing protein n=1 Tax=Aquimarina sp. MAR_2010_214 TaxID=1250026 RepID=UPI000C7134EF|nr:zinc-ribbon domain-containing protein [Aquimarina sp. MAR_2010_214]PKV49895.1 zinc ribbon family protein [Aquimarina sp. MAR_2010_214]
MIIFGTGSSTIQPKKLEGGNCPYCNTENNMWIQGYKKYVHVFWIPFFPIGKKVYSVCGHCKGAFEKNEIQSQELIQSFEYSKNNDIKTPWYHFIGLAILLTGISLLTILSYLR